MVLQLTKLVTGSMRYPEGNEWREFNKNHKPGYTLIAHGLHGWQKL
jgi:hypothetical protein